jgi:mannose-6-phosphate isomerase-like protein (cupin superfamily)
MIFDLTGNTKDSVFDSVIKGLWRRSLPHASVVRDKPWGGYFTFDQKRTQQFIELFFQGVDTSMIQPDLAISPKILVVEPGKRLSWQYHHRRTELWRCIYNRVSVVLSDDDTEKDTILLEEGEHIYIKKEQRHRITGMRHYGILAELWIHADPTHPSDEEDIVRVQDDFGR